MIHSHPTFPPPRTISGRWVVVGMFAFGTVMTGTLWAYWHLHTAPFRPLQAAIVAAYPGSGPHVEGGRHKSHKGTPSLLRIVMRVDFDPTADKPRAATLGRKVAELAGRHHDLSRYEQLEIHLYLPKPEDTIRQETITIPVADVAAQ